MRNTLLRSSLFLILLLVTCLSITRVLSPVYAVQHGGPPSAAQEAFRQKLHAQFVDIMKTQRVPGAVIYVQSERTGTWTTTTGTSNLATGAPITADMHFRIGSITKTFTATVILQLVREGKLSLDDPMSTFNLGVPNGENITLRQVLNMTSGLFNYSEDDDFNKIAAQEVTGTNTDKIWTPRELLAYAFKNPSYFPPGQGLHYSNTNYILLGLIIEQVTGNTPKVEFQRRLFTPLGMTHTVIPDPDDASLPVPFSEGYSFVEAQVGTTLPASVQPVNNTRINPSWGGTAGDAISTLADLKIWVKALGTGELIGPELQAKRLQFRDFPGQFPVTIKYGLGIADFGGFIGHNGGIPGYQSFAVYNAERDATVITLTNLDPSANGLGAADTISEAIIEALVDKDIPTVANPPSVGNRKS